jgi:cell filamentation protein
MNNSDDTYPNGTLRNRLGITDAAQLARYEYLLTARRSIYLLDHPVHIDSTEQLVQIHLFLFGSLYDWAGKIRDYELSKGDTQFMLSEKIDDGRRYCDTLINKLPKGKLAPLNYARLLDALNYLHPFREGNGRSTRLFLQMLAAQHRQYLDYPRHDQTLIAAEAAGNIEALATLLKIADSTEEILLHRALRQLYSSKDDA